MVEQLEYCRNGHVRSEENTVWEKGSNGRARRRCRICRQNSRAQRMRNRTGIDALQVRPVRLYSELDPDELKATREFYEALDMVDAKCKNKPELWSDYDEEHIPTPGYATKLCAQCPLAALCTREAKIMNHGWTVRGAEVYVYGHVYLDGTFNGPEDNEEEDK